MSTAPASNLTSQPLPFGPYLRLPDSLLRIFGYAQGISRSRGGVFVIEASQFFEDEYALPTSKTASQAQPFQFDESLMTHIRR
jgi:hypothetical protein